MNGVELMRSRAWGLEIGAFEIGFLHMFTMTRVDVPAHVTQPAHED